MKTRFFYVLFMLFNLNVFAQKIQTLEVDSAYKKKGISITLENSTNEKESSFEDKNCILIIRQKTKNKNTVLLKDTIYSSVQEIDFKDFNNDKINDLLVQNISDVRSNWTYTLYLYNPKTNSFKKVTGFEEIKNPIFNSKYNIIESHVNSGQNWAAFYKIKNNKVFSYNIEIIDDGSDKAAKEYAKAIKKIIKTDK